MRKSKLKTANSPSPFPEVVCREDSAVENTAATASGSLSVLQNKPSEPAGASGLLPAVSAKYRLIDELGRGSMGCVYRAESVDLARMVALKRLLPEGVSDPLQRKRFEREAKAASLLTHPNLVSLYDFGISDDGAPFLVMDLIDGISLSALLRQTHQLSVARVLNIGRQICDGLEYAHSKKVIHRDLKPNNIMISSSEEELDLVKIVDFGIAKVISPEEQLDEQRLTQTGDVLGSPVYMSPEQCIGQHSDERSDIYSFGCVMYEALMGAPPFLADNVVQTIMDHINLKPLSFASFRPDLDVPEALEQIIMRCLEKKPSDRFQTVAEVREQLELVSMDTSESRKKLIRDRVRKAKLQSFISNRKTALSVSFALVLALTAAAATGWYLKVSSDDRAYQTHLAMAESNLGANEPEHLRAALLEAKRLNVPPKALSALQMRLAESLRDSPLKPGPERQRQASMLQRHEALKNAREAYQRLNGVEGGDSLRLEGLTLICDLLSADAPSSVGDPKAENARSKLATDLHNDGIRFLHERKFDQAIKKLEASAKLYPYAFPGQERYLSSALYQKALSAPVSEQVALFKKALKVDPANPYAAAALERLTRPPGAKPRTASDYCKAVIDSLARGDYDAAVTEAAGSTQSKNQVPRVFSNEFVALLIEVDKSRSHLDQAAVQPNKNAAELTATLIDKMKLEQQLLGLTNERVVDSCRLLVEELSKAKRLTEAEGVLRSYLSSAKKDTLVSDGSVEMTGRLMVLQARQGNWTDARASADQFFASLREHPDRWTHGHNGQLIREYFDLARNGGHKSEIARAAASLIDTGI